MVTDVIINRNSGSVEINSRNSHLYYDWVSDNVNVCDENYYTIKIKGKSGTKGEIILPRATTNLIVFG